MNIIGKEENIQNICMLIYHMVLLKVPVNIGIEIILGYLTPELVNDLFNRVYVFCL